MAPGVLEPLGLLAAPRVGAGCMAVAASTTLASVAFLAGYSSYIVPVAAIAGGLLAFALAPGAFIVLAYLMVIFRKITKKA